MKLVYSGTWRSYKKQNGPGYEGATINGSTLAYSTQTGPFARKEELMANLAKLSEEFNPAIRN